MKPELIKKIESGQTLNPKEEAVVEAYLSSVENSEIASMLQGLPKDIPSLAWRASLNEKIARIASKPTSLWKRLVPYGLGALVGSGAMALAFMFVLNQQYNTMPLYDADALGKAILEWHEEAVASSVLPGDRITLELAPYHSPSDEAETVEDLLYGGPFDQL